MKILYLDVGQDAICVHWKPSNWIFKKPNKWNKYKWGNTVFNQKCNINICEKGFLGPGRVSAATLGSTSICQLLLMEVIAFFLALSGFAQIVLTKSVNLFQSVLEC